IFSAELLIRLLMRLYSLAVGDYRFYKHSASNFYCITLLVQNSTNCRLLCYRRELDRRSINYFIICWIVFICLRGYWRLIGNLSASSFSLLFAGWKWI